MRSALPAYVDRLIEGFRRGAVGRFVHLGHWDDPGATSTSQDDFQRAQARLNDIALEGADLKSGQSVLDVGCGFGGSLEAINRRWPDMALVGVNIDARQLELCRQIVPLNGNRLRWAQADACRLPFPAASFDRMLCIEAMFHFASRRTFFAEAARLLRPGGVLVATDIVLADGARRARLPAAQIEAAIQRGFGPWPDLWCAGGDHRELAAAAGLRCTRIQDATASTLPSHRFTAPSRDPRPGGDATADASLMLQWLHRGGLLRYLYLRFDKP